MAKIVIPLSSCVPGMITAEKVLNIQTGLLILSSNQEITQQYIDDLAKFPHSDIWVNLNSSNQIWPISDEVIRKYQIYTHALETIITKPSPDMPIDVERFEEMSNFLGSDFKSNHELLGVSHIMGQLDTTTYTHSLNVAFLCITICRWLHTEEDVMVDVIKAALLHDIGIRDLPFDIYKGLDLLTSDEFAEYKCHSMYGYNAIKRISTLSPEICKAVLAHHEHYDGSGFPFAAALPATSTLTKILAIAEEYELLRKKHHIFDVLETLLTTGLTQFDPQILLTFCTNIVNYFSGVYVTLSNGAVGEVVFIEPQCIYKPAIKIQGKILYLRKHPSIKIVSVY